MNRIIALLVFFLVCAYSAEVLVFESVKQLKVFDLNAFVATLSDPELSTDFDQYSFYWTPTKNSTRGIITGATILQQTGPISYSAVGDTQTIRLSDGPNGNGLQVGYSTFRNCGGRLSTAQVVIICDSGVTVPEFTLTQHDDLYCNLEFALKSDCAWVTVLDNTCSSSDSTACGASNNRGECFLASSTDTTGFCDCYSGYSGSKCSFDPHPNFAPATVYAQNLDLKAEFDYELTNTVTFSVALPSEKGPGLDNAMQALTTTLRFTGGTSDCDYPNSNLWVLKNNGTADFYSATFTYPQITACGLTNDGVDSSGNYQVFSNFLTVKRTYRLKDGQFSLNRTVGPKYAFTFLFPKKVSVKLNVDMIDNYISQFTAVSGSSYDKATNNWNFQFSALIKAPYQLSLASVPSSSGEHELRVVNTGLLSTCPLTTGATEFCHQIFTVAASDCFSLKFQVQANFTVTCRPNSLCVDAATPWFVATFTIATTDSCPIDKDVAISDLSMASFKDADLLESFSLFGKSQNIYFAVTFGTAAHVSATTIDRVCVSTTAQQPGDCTSGIIPFLSSVPSDGLSAHTLNGGPVQTSFSITGDSVNTQIPLSRTQVSTIYIQADLTVTYDGFTAKRNLQFDSARTYFKIKDEETKVGADQPKKALDPSSAQILCSSLFLTALIAALL